MALPVVLIVSLLLQAAAGVVAAPSNKTEREPYVAPFVPMADPPKLPKVDLNACPFEGCQFGKWTANRKVVVYSTWESSRQPIATLSKNDEVTALTGVNIVLEPGKGIFDRNAPIYGAKQSDPAYLYRSCGEGEYDMWVHGRFIECADPQFTWKPGYGCQKNCYGRWLSLVKSEWWAQIRLKDGTTGWVLVKDNFDGIDALAPEGS